MKKTEWEETYRKLDNMYSDFLMIYRGDYKNGKTKMIRQKAENELRYIISRIKSDIYNTDEIYELLVSDNTGGIVHLDQEFGTLQYFESDMSDVLRKIREKINTLSETV